MPDPDLLIRTAGEMRVSNFLLWQISYAEIWVTDVLWPDFRGEDLLAACRAFAGRERKFGGLPRQGLVVSGLKGPSRHDHPNRRKPPPMLGTRLVMGFAMVGVDPTGALARRTVRALVPDLVRAGDGRALVVGRSSWSAC